MVNSVDTKSSGVPTKVGEVKEVAEYRLDNGLRVLISENHSAPVATLLVVYRVGSRNEGVGFTGSTHFLEHMLFKGTEEHNNDKGNGMDDLLTQIGAHWNATTWFDRTSYYEVVPNDFLELCIELEADRMRNLRLRQEDRDSEMSVVRNELERGENHPEEALEKELYAIAFREHPYHHPTIGWRSDVEGVPMDRLRQFYDTFYWPDNATVIALGDFATADALSMINHHFGKIPRAPQPIPTVYTTEPPQEGERRFEVNRAGDMPRVWIGYHVPEATHADNHAIAAMRQLLGSTYERSSRLYKRLIDTSLANEVFARHDDLRDPGLFIVGATINPGVDLQRVEKELLEEIERLSLEAASDAELKRIKSSNAKGTILSKADPSSLAFMLGEAESKADWKWLMEYDDKFDAVSKEDIMRVAGTYFSKRNRTVGYFLPKDDGDVCSDDDEMDFDPDSQDFDDEIVNEEMEAPAPAGKSGDGMEPLYSPAEIKSFLELKPIPVTVTFKNKATSTYVSKVRKEMLPNGMTILLMQNPGTESVALSLNMKAGRYFSYQMPGSPAELVGDLLPTGSRHYDKTKIAEMLEEMGCPGGLEFFVDNYRIGVGAQLVVSDLPEYLDLLNDVVRNPLLADDELAKIKVEWASRFLESKMNTRSMAWNKLRQALYPVGHPFYDKGFDEQAKELEGITSETLHAVHKKHFSPANTIITLVGDIDLEQSLKLIADRFGDWKGEKAPLIEIADVGLPAAASRLDVFLPEKASVDIVMAHPCQLKRSAEDFYAARIGNAALGQDTITSRLGQVVRDKAGLTYGIYSSFSDTAFGGAPWTVSLSSNPKNVDRALQLIDVTLSDYLSKGISKEDLAKESGRALGSFKVGLASSMGIARVLTEFEFLGLGAEELDRIQERYMTLTKEKVDQAMKLYFHPEKSITVVSGTLVKR
ncbi:MAG: insulinase family protein [Cyanobacteria bacterium SZAS LIN-3]|nr:insulinase family protein [Cyanobacteria bacterium SZAS LIN-3]